MQNYKSFAWRYKLIKNFNEVNMKKKLITLVICVSGGLILTACQERAKVMTVAEYMHDIDAHEIARKKYENNRSLADENVSDATNVFSVKARLSFGGRGTECWPKNEERTTANTNHTCLDNAGYKR